MTALALPAVAPASNGHKPIPFPVAPSIPARRVSRPGGRWAWLSVAAALLVLLAGFGGWFAYDRYASNDSSPAVIPAVQATPAVGWPQFRGDAAGTAYTADLGPGGDLDLRWTFTASEAMGNLVSDGDSIYVYGRKGDLFALDAVTGSQRWGVDLSPNEYSDANMWPNPAVHDGVIYTGTFDGNMVALDVTDGSVIWQQDLSNKPITASASIVDDALYLLTPERTIVALNLATGAANWEWSGEILLSNWASAVGGGSIYIITDNELSLVAIDTATGETRWVADLAGVRGGVGYADGRVYVTNDNQSYYALDATDGSVLWTSDPVPGDQTYSPAVTPTLVIASSQNGPTRALDRKSGEVIWSVDGAEASVRPIASANAVYVVSEDQASLEAYDLANGNELWRMDYEGETRGIITGDTFVSGSNEDPGVVRSYGPGNGEPFAVTAGPTTVLAPVAAEAPPSVALESAFDASQIGFVWDMTTIGETTLQAPSPQIGPDGNLYVANLNNTTYILSPESELIDQLPASGSIGFDADGNIYIFNTASMHIKKFAPDHTLLTEWGGEGSGNGQFSIEVEGTVDPVNGLVYAVDYGNNRVQVFDLEGNFLDKWGSAGAGNGEFIEPVAAKVGPDGLIYVGDTGARVQIFDRNGTYKGTLLDADGNPASISGAWGIAFDSAGNIYASDYFGHSIRVFDPQWREIGAIADVEGAGAFTYPIQLSIDADDNLYVGDFFGEGDFGRIVKLALPLAE